jgi:PAS domain S-box-containing protein
VVKREISEETMATMKDTPDSKLRQRAEQKLKEASSGSEDLSGISPERMASLIHELRVHQIELEMQNDELRHIQGELEKTRDRYSHLYDFAPLGYFTVSEKEIIEEVNLTGATLLGIERRALIGKPFFRFVCRDNQDIFYKFRQRLLETEKPQSCELRLVKKDGHEFHARLDCMVIKNRGDDLRQIRAAVSDITERKLAQEQRDKLIAELQKALSEVKTLRGFLPICSNCKNIRDDKGYWNQIESYIRDHSDAEFSHGICPECAKKLYPDMDLYDDNGEVTED